MTEERKFQFDKAYMQMAESMASLSYAERRKVGCIIVSPDGQLISQGFNGTPSGCDNCCENKIYEYEPDENCPYIGRGACNRPTCEGCEHRIESGYTLVTKPEVLHAETNAITKCAKWMASTENATLYVTLSPCLDCSKLIIQAGIKRVVFKEKYRDTTGIDLLKRIGIQVQQIDNDKLIEQ